MPKIEEYETQSIAEGPVGGTTPLIDEVTKAGRGISDFGRGLEDAGDLLLRRQTQAESSQASAAASGLRASYTVNTDQQIQDGTIDSKRLLDQYDEDSKKIRDSLDMPGAQNLYDKQSARVRAQLAIKATRGQALVAGKNAVASWNDTVTSNTNTLAADPAQFDSVAEGEKDNIQHLIDTGAISAAAAPHLQSETIKKYAVSTVMGRADADFKAAVQEGQDALARGGPGAVPKAEALTQAITSFKSAENELGAEKYKDILSETDRKNLLNYQKSKQSEAVTEITRMVAVQKGIIQEKQENWLGGNWANLHAGKISTQDIAHSPLSFEQKNAAFNLLKRSTEEQLSDPKIHNDLLQRIVAPTNSQDAITDPFQITKYVGPGGITTKDAESLSKFLTSSTPGGAALQANRKGVIAVARQSLVGSGGIMGIKDPSGEYNMQLFTHYIQKKEDDLRKEGKPIDSLYDVSSPDYVASPEKLQSFKRTPKQIMDDSAAQAMGTYTPPQMGVVPPGVKQDQAESKQDPQIIDYAKKYYGGDYQKAEALINSRKKKRGG